MMRQRSLPRLATVLLVAQVAAPHAGAAAVRQMFVTSVAGNGNLGSWPDAGAATGLAAGDAICQTRAFVAGLPGPTNFVAWLSTATTDAYCHVHALTGKKSANCGLPVLPAAAGPWMRTDGVPWGADITQLLDPDDWVFLPARIDESGNPVSGAYWTGTESDGAVGQSRCLNWTSSSLLDSGVGGSTEETAYGWTQIFLADCSTHQHLLCLERPAGDPLPRFANWGRFAFVTSASGNGRLTSWPQAGGQTGAAAGNAICRSLAATAGLANATKYKAWLSTSTADARDRIVNDGPFMRLDRVRLAPSLAGLTDGTLNTTINLTETGAYVTSTAWTGTLENGTADPAHCNDWTSAAANVEGVQGLAYAADGAWTRDYLPIGCDGSKRLYCFEDVPLVFRDGFESGDTRVWSSVVP